MKSDSNTNDGVVLTEDPKFPVQKISSNDWRTKTKVNTCIKNTQSKLPLHTSTMMFAICEFGSVMLFVLSTFPTMTAPPPKSKKVHFCTLELCVALFKATAQAPARAEDSQIFTKKERASAWS